MNKELSVLEQKFREVGYMERTIKIIEELNNAESEDDKIYNLKQEMSYWGN